MSAGEEELRARLVEALDNAHKTQPCTCGAQYWYDCSHEGAPSHSERRADAVLAALNTHLAEVQNEVTPAWEAVYEPGNVSDYLIGFTNDEIPAKRAAEAWFRSQCDTWNDTDWVADPQLATGRYDVWHELVQIDSDDRVVLSTGIIVRRRRANGGAA